MIFNQKVRTLSKSENTEEAEYIRVEVDTSKPGYLDLINTYRGVPLNEVPEEYLDLIGLNKDCTPRKSVV